jgi:hypothetical protein
MGGAINADPEALAQLSAMSPVRSTPEWWKPKSP